MRTSSRKILVVGSGAREHALARALERAPSVAEVIVMPGNAGVADPGAPGRAPIRRSAFPIGAPIEAVILTVRSEEVDLVVIGPEAPLVAGMVDALSAEGILAFGPTK